MRKPLLILFLLVVYTGSVSGATFHLHFCGDHLQIISFAGMGHDKCCCGEGEAKKKENCCTDKVVTVKVSDQHTLSADHLPSCISCAKVIPQAIATFLPATALFVDTHSTHRHPPPPEISGNPVSLSLLHCVFRI